MHIVNVIGSITNQTGGVGSFISDLSFHLATTPADYSIITRYFSGVPNLPIESKVSVHSVVDNAIDTLNCLQREKSIDALHLHGLWLPILRNSSIWAQNESVIWVCSPHGMLMPWALNHKKWKKRLAYLLYQKRILQNTTAFHACSEQEAQNLRRMGLKQPIAVIPNGVRLPNLEDGGMKVGNLKPEVESGGMKVGDLRAENLTESDSLEMVNRERFVPEGFQRRVPNGRLCNKPEGGRFVGKSLEASSLSPQLSALKPQSSNLIPPRKTAFFLSRINPVKGLPMLLDAWKSVAPEGWQLVIAGNDDENHLPIVEAKIRELGLADQVTLLGPLFGEAKDQAFREADLFLLPSFSENFGIVVTEALSYQVPVLTTTGCPWQILEDRGCGWWVDPNPKGIESGLRAALGTSDAERVVMGQRGRQLVEEKYQWPEIADKFYRFYDWVHRGGAKPGFLFEG